MNDSVPTASQPENTGALIDREVLHQLLEDVGLENAGGLLETFLEEIAGQAKVIEAAAAKGDLQELARAAHRLKGSAAAFGAVPLHRVVLRIEGHARAGELGPAVATMAAFHPLVQASLESIGRIRDGLLDTFP